MKYIWMWLVTLGAFALIDALWLGLVAPSFYKKHLGYIMAPHPNWTAAVLFYLLFMVGLVVFVVLPSSTSRALGIVFVYGALFGLVTYATYDLTNHATIKDWPTIVTGVDLLWGTVLTGSVSVVSVAICRGLGLL